MKERKSFEKQSLNRKLAGFGLLIIVLLQMMLMIHFGNQKAGYFVDEMATYTLSNYKDPFISWTDGFLGSWQERGVFTSSLVVDEGEAFDYATVYHNQEEDVHPPLYYFVIHTVSSLFPGEFSKWLGIVPNIIFCLLTTLILFLCARRLFANSWGALFVTAAWAFSVGCMSMAVFIRMYAMLAFFCVLLLWLHLRAVDQLLSRTMKLRGFVALWLCTTCGILTQYYFLIYCFFLCGAFFLFLLVRKDWKSLLKYLVAEFGAILTSVVFFPAMLEHIFSGYRGEEAFANMGNGAHYAERIKQAVSIISSDLMNGWARELLLLIAACAIISWLNRKLLHIAFCAQEEDRCIQIRWNVHRDWKSTLRLTQNTLMYIGICGVLVGYIVLVARISPYQVDRYYMCIYPVVTLVLGYFFWLGCGVLFANRKVRTGSFAVLLFAVLVLSYKTQTVNYLYRNYESRKVLAEYSQYPVVAVNFTNYTWAPSTYIEEYQMYPRTLWCTDNGSLQGLKVAQESGELKNGFLLYVIGDGGNDEELMYKLGKEVSIDNFECIAMDGARVYFCTLED